jgi:hypothetical protein
MKPNCDICGGPMVKMEKGEYHFFVKVDVSERLTVEISGDKIDPPFMALVAATEHMMTLCAMQSPHKDFNHTLERLCDGARKNEIKEFKKQRLQ